MGELIVIGDNVALASGRRGTVKAFELYAGGLYVLDVEGETVVAQRHQFTPMKWEAPKVTSTGIGCCAQGANGQ